MLSMLIKTLKAGEVVLANDFALLNNVTNFRNSCRDDIKSFPGEK